MKFLIALSLLATSAASFASTRSIFDLQYLPKAGTAYGTTDASITNYDILYKNTKADIDYDRLSQTVGFSVMDNLLLSVSSDYLRGSVKTSGVATSRSEGLSDPTVSGKFRLSDDEYIVDVIADYLVSTGDNKTNSTSTRSDNKNGGSVANLAGQIGSKSADFQWAVLAKFTRNFESTIDSAGTKVDFKAHNQYYVEGSTLMNLSVTDWKFKTTLSALAVDKYKDDNSSYASVTQLALGGEWQYICSANFMARGGLTFIDTISNHIQQNHGWKFNVGATYQF